MSQPPAHRILLVEDNDLNRALARTVLARSDDPIAARCGLVEATSLGAARTALAAGPFDVVLLDMHLPDGHGLTLVDELTTQPNPSRPVIVALTASALPEQRDAAFAAGCDDFLAKPYRPQQLIALLTTYLGASDKT